MKECHEDYICESFLYAMNSEIVQTWNGKEFVYDYQRDENGKIAH
jgi:uncharacterized protein YprB with RNaseH-like and TPR domain